MDKQYLSPKISKPTKEEFQETAKKLGFHIDDQHTNSYLRMTHEWLSGYDHLINLPSYLPKVKYPRFPGEIPSKSENTNNAWSVKVNIKGASSGKLAGKTVVLKDNICLAGVQMTNGTAHLEGYMPEIDATIVTRLLDAGATIVGKANTECLCFAGGSVTSYKGPVHNPLAFGYSAGGSSSGVCSIVGNGESNLGVGTDNGGSIRIPSSWCGCVGMKPTFGLCPMTGIMSMENTSDHCGPITRNCLDNALMLEILAGMDEDEMDPRQRIPEGFQLDFTSHIKDGIKGLKIAYLKETLEENSKSLSFPVYKAVKEALKKFEELGATIVEASCPELGEAALVCEISLLEGFYHNMMQNGEQAASKGLFIPSSMKAHSNWKNQADDLSETVKISMLTCEYIKNKYPGLAAYGKAQNLGRHVKKIFNERFKKQEFDLLILPTIPFLPKALPEKNCDLEEFIGAALGMGRNTGSFNITGNPALTMPVGKEDKFSIGMMIVGPLFGEVTIYKAAYSLEQELLKSKSL